MYNTEEQIRCSRTELEEFSKSRVWLEMRSWLEARRDRLADDLDLAGNEVEIQLIQRERRVLRDLLRLPELLMELLLLHTKEEHENGENHTGE